MITVFSFLFDRTKTSEAKSVGRADECNFVVRRLVHDEFDRNGLLRIGSATRSTRFVQLKGRVNTADTRVVRSVPRCSLFGQRIRDCRRRRRRGKRSHQPRHRGGGSCGVLIIIIIVITSRFFF